MTKMKYEIGGKCVELEVTEEFAAAYAELEREERLSERRETRRHCSLERAVECGWDSADPESDVVLLAERAEDRAFLRKAIQTLTDQQRSVLSLCFEDGRSFREAASDLGLNKETVREHYAAAIKKLRNFLQNTPPKADSRG